MTTHPWTDRTHPRPRGRLRSVAPSLKGWVGSCALAEAVGLTAAAGAAVAAQSVLDDQGLAGARTWAVAAIVAAGLVEGAALGVAQGRPLSRWLPRLRARHYVLATLLVAGLGWGIASVPAVLGGDAGGADPSWWLMLLAGLGLGLVMGPVLGSAQAYAMRGAVRHPWRWVDANLVAWPLAMAVIFVGASWPGAEWSVGWVLAAAALTGLAAGGVLGLVTWCFLPSLTGAPLHHTFLVGWLASPWRGRLDRRLTALEVRDRARGSNSHVPVRYAVDEDGLVVVPRHVDDKDWWPLLEDPVTPLGVMWAGDWAPVVADVLRPGDPGYVAALSTYRRRWSRLRLSEVEVVARLRAAPPDAPAAVAAERAEYVTSA